MKHFISILLLLIFSSKNFLFAQNIADEDPTWRNDSAKIHQKIDYTFMNLDKSKLVTGYLLDRIPFSILNMLFFDGKKDSVITTDMWLQLYFELKHFAEFTPTSLPTSKTLKNRIDSIKANNIVPLGIINMDYNHFTEDAYSSGMLTVQNEQVFENFSSPDSPYGIKRFFAVAKLGTLKIQNSVSYLVDSSFYFSNASGSIIKFDIDFGDGIGFRTVQFGDIVNIIYPDTGNIIITTQAIYPTDTLQCKTHARVIGFIAVQNKTSPPLGDCDVFKENPDITDYFPPDDFFYLSGGRGYVKYGCENTTGKLRKPFIFVEGIDFGANAPDDVTGTRYGDLGWYQIILARQYKKDDPVSDAEDVKDPNIAKVPILMKKLCSEGYDLIMLDFADGATGIDVNAMVLVELIQKVNQQLKDNGSKQQIVVMGVSMGGQVSRYALRYMELNESSTGPHNTRLFISFDSPNSGANIPLGTQLAIRYTTFWLGKQLMPQLFRPATKQLMRYHYMPTLVINDDNPYPYNEHTELYFINPNMTTFPQKPYKVAIANGSGLGDTQGYGPGAKTINIVTGRTLEAWAVPALSEQTIFRGSYSVVFILVTIVALSFIPIIGWILAAITTIVIITTTDINKIKNALPYDNTSGGYRTTNQDVVEGVVSAWGGNIFNYAAINKNHAFIPTFSAFGLNANLVTVSASMSSYLGATVLPGGKGMQFYDPTHSKTPFDVVYAPVENQQHVNITDNNIDWIMDEVAPQNLFLQNRPLSNPYNPIVSNAPLNGWAYDARNKITIGYDVDNSTYGGITGRQQPGDFVVEGNGTTGATVDIHAGNEIHLVGGPGNNGVWFKKGSNVHLCVKPFQCDAVCRLANTNDDDGSNKNKGENYLVSASKGGSDFSSGEIKKTEIFHPINETEISKPTNIFPNPFNDHLHIDYSVQNESPVNISVYNLTGQKMAELVSTNQHQAGNYTTTFDARKFSTGVYYIRIVANEKSETVKVVKMK